MGALRLHPARRDGVDADFARAKLGGEHARQRVDRTLGGRVDCRCRHRLLAGHRRDVDDAAAVRAEMLGRFLGGQDSAEHVGVEL